LTEPAQDSPAKLNRLDLETEFHIEYDWWERADRDLHVFLRSQMCERHQEIYSDSDLEAMVDHVDPRTGEVSQTAFVQDLLARHCSQEEGYITPQTSMINAIFRTLLANGNRPMSSRQLADQIDRPPETILRTLSGSRVYKGIRPV